MKKINLADDLKKQILQLEIKRDAELVLLKDQFQEVRESLKPINLIKSTFKDVSNSSGIKKGLLDNVIGLSAGLLSKKLLIGATSNPIKKILGTILEYTVARVVAFKRQ